MTTTSISRRTWLQRTATGFGALALHDLVQAAQSPLAVKAPHLPAKAKRVIFLFMSGGPSQPDLFDPKSYIKRMHGKTISAPINTNELRVGTDKFLALATQRDVRPRGQSGMMISDLLPQTASIADEICLLRAMHSDNNQHQPAALQFHTGVTADVRPSMGSWISYGLGAENQNLPSFISIHPDSDTRLYGSGFLPAAHQGTKVIIPQSDKQSPIDYLANVSGDAKTQRARIDFTQRMNSRLLQRAEVDARMEGMIESMEIAFRMQSATPELVDISNESEATKKLYGIGEKTTDKNGRACLLARRLSEAGVRFVQVTMGGWDHHGDIRNALPKSCAGTDQPCAALIKDLKSRGLLEDTLVIWGGEFGRMPMSEKGVGRDHNPWGYTTVLFGAGVKHGHVHGATDEFGLRAALDKVHIHELHATILHLLGMDHERLTFRRNGLDERLTGVEECSVVKGVLA